MADDKKGDYEVGYGRPPKTSQWKKGQSGNPKGRTRNAKGLRTIIKEQAYARQRIQVAGQTVTGSRMELAIKTAFMRAGSGDLKAIRLIVELIQEHLGADDPGERRDALSAHDRALLEQLLATIEADEVNVRLPSDETSESQETAGERDDDRQA